MTTPDDKDQVQGEGDYDAARRYDKSVEQFAKSGKVEPAAKAAHRSPRKRPTSSSAPKRKASRTPRAKAKAR